MKIALYVPSWPPGSSANGIVTYAAEVVPALRRLGHDVFVITSNSMMSASDIYTIDLNKIDVPRSMLSRAKARLLPEQAFLDNSAKKLLAAVLRLRDGGLDVMEIEESFGWSLKIAQAKLIPLVVRLHGPWFLNANFDNNIESGRQHRITREGRGIAAANVITAPSSDVLGKVRSYYGCELQNARVIPNPINVDVNATAWQLSTCNVNRILYVGRFDRRKGGDIVLKAFAHLAERYPDLHLTFVGPDRGVYEGENRLSFDHFVRHTLPSFCWPRIDFRGQLTHQEVMALRTKHLITIVASQFEILPYSVLEAMSLGCPIVASRVGGIPELIVDEKNGLLFANQNIAELVLACRRLLDDHILAASLGSQARSDCLRYFNVEHIAAETISAYRAAIKFHQNGMRPREIDYP